MNAEEKKKIEETFPPRALTRKEIKSLRGQGINLAQITPANADEAVDTVMATAYSPEAIEKIDAEPNTATLHLFERIVEKTYGGGEPEKN